MTITVPSESSVNESPSTDSVGFAVSKSANHWSWSIRADSQPISVIARPPEITSVSSSMVALPLMLLHPAFAEIPSSVKLSCRFVDRTSAVGFPLISTECETYVRPDTSELDAGSADWVVEPQPLSASNATVPRPTKCDLFMPMRLAVPLHGSTR